MERREAAGRDFGGLRVFPRFVWADLGALGRPSVRLSYLSGIGERGGCGVGGGCQRGAWPIATVPRIFSPPGGRALPPNIPGFSGLNKGVVLGRSHPHPVAFPPFPSHPPQVLGVAELRYEPFDLEVAFGQLAVAELTVVHYHREAGGKSRRDSASSANGHLRSPSHAAVAQIFQAAGPGPWPLRPCLEIFSALGGRALPPNIPGFSGLNKGVVGWGGGRFS